MRRGHYVPTSSWSATSRRAAATRPRVPTRGSGSSTRGGVPRDPVLRRSVLPDAAWRVSAVARPAAVDGGVSQHRSRRRRTSCGSTPIRRSSSGIPGVIDGSIFHGTDHQFAHTFCASRKRPAALPAGTQSVDVQMMTDGRRGDLHRTGSPGRSCIAGTRRRAAGWKAGTASAGPAADVAAQTPLHSPGTGAHNQRLRRVLRRLTRQGRQPQ